MRHILLIIGLFLPLLSFSQEEIEYSEYSYSDFFQMIEDEPDSIFSLENSRIIYSEKTDSTHLASIVELGADSVIVSPFRNDTIYINKHVSLHNVQFIDDKNLNENASKTSVGIYNVRFNKSVKITNTSTALFSHCFFNAFTEIKHDGSPFTPLDKVLDQVVFHQSSFMKGVDLSYGKFFSEKKLPVSIIIIESKIHSDINTQPYKKSQLRAFRSMDLLIEDCLFSGMGEVTIIGHELTQFRIKNNVFSDETLPMFGTMIKDGALSYEIIENDFRNLIITTLDFNNPTLRFDWDQNKKGIASQPSYDAAYNRKFQTQEHKKPYFTSFVEDYLDNLRIKAPNTFRLETKLLGSIYNKYKQEHDSEFANKVYIELKDLETERLAYLHQENRSFKSYFSWKINQFLKIFSAYGTEPARAITMSVYVVLAFALIYLFFPNHWDSHGKNRIVDRYSFFLKYMKRDAGMHDVYLEEKLPELLAYDEYKNLIESSGKDIPKFFQATALPIYKWAISSTKITASLLSKVDVVKGTWSELPQSKRPWKSILLTGAFLIALLYDIFIKMLNALMLSINTFTTLGFGEIPIKGLPRYLAIIQGFIGWFMLTIFSVSLISQLLG